MDIIRTPILIVGAGPVGLGLGLELAWNGQAAMIIEQTDGVITQPKIGVMAVRTMEFFRRWGIVDRIRNGGFPDDYELSQVFCTSLGGWLIDREYYPSTRNLPTPSWSPHKKQRCPQIWLNPILQKAVEEHACIDLRLRCKLKSLEQHQSHVDAVVEDLETGRHFKIIADYLVGCDGAGSEVRKALDITLSGKAKLSYSTSILLKCKGLLDHIDKGQAERYIFIGPEGTWGNWTVVDGKDEWRLTLLGGTEREQISLEQAHASVRRALGADLPYEIQSLITWRRTELIADKFGAGRILLAGDSVHTMSPTGGMGMNTGMGDAVDLGWKLSAVMQGWGGPHLLQTYETERRPVAIRNGAFSTHNFSAWAANEDCSRILDDDSEGQALRERIGRGLRDSTRTDWEPWGLQMGYRYEGSPIIIPDGTPPTDDDYIKYIPTTRPGSRAPHAWIHEGESMLDLIGRGFTMFSFGPEARDPTPCEAFAQKIGVPYRFVQINNPEIAKLYECPLVLVRSDGHVAWRGTADDCAKSTLATVAGWTL